MFKSHFYKRCLRSGLVAFNNTRLSATWLSGWQAQLQIILLLTMAPLALNASEALRIPPFEHNAIPGGIALIKVGPTTDAKPTVRWLKKNIAVVAHKAHWWAVAGIPLSSKAGQHELEVLQENDTDNKVAFTVAFTINPHAYKEQRITITDKRKVNPAPLDMKRINKENKRIREVKAYSYNKLLASEFKLPVKGILTSPFGLKRFFNDQPRRPHGGIDIAAKTGTPIHAPAKGLVVDTGDYFFNGNSIFLEHGLGLQTFYAHMSKIHVKAGDTVQAGDIIGEVGATGRVTGPHLHWSVGLNGTWIDPYLVMPEQ